MGLGIEIIGLILLQLREICLDDYQDEHQETERVDTANGKPRVICLYSYQSALAPARDVILFASLLFSIIFFFLQSKVLHLS